MAELDYMTRKEILQLSKTIKEQTGISMNLVHILLDEQSQLESFIEYASEINAERAMSAGCSGFNPYDIERVQIGKEKRRLNEIYVRLSPRPQTIMVNVFEPYLIGDDELPF